MSSFENDTRTDIKIAKIFNADDLRRTNCLLEIIALKTGIICDYLGMIDEKLKNIDKKDGE